MTRYAARAVPWVPLGVSFLLVVALTEFARLRPGPTWGLLAVAVAVLAGAVAWCEDEPAARVVDTAPRSLAWRTAARVPVVALLGLTWTVQVTRSRDELYGRDAELLVQGFAAMAVGLAWAAWRRARGAAMPGARFATAAVPLAMVTAMVPPVSTHLWLFPFAVDADRHWEVSQGGWLGAAAIAVLVLAAALADAPWWRIHRLP